MECEAIDDPGQLIKEEEVAVYKAYQPRAALAAEFQANPYGEHSPDLQYLLNLMRRPSRGPFHVLLVERPGERWRLGIMDPEAHAAPRPMDVVFDNLEEAERYVFNLRLDGLREGRHVVTPDCSSARDVPLRS